MSGTGLYRSLRVRNQKQEIIIIEIQYDREYDYLQRIFYGVSKTVIEGMKEKQPYSGITKVISINILYFDLGSGTDYIYKGTTRFIGLHNHDLLELNEKQKQLFQKESVEALYPEYYLIKINRFNDIARDTLDEWIYFLKNEEIKESFTAKGLKEAEEKLSIMKLPEEERKAYEHYKDDLHYQASMFESSYGDGYHVGKEEGVEIGLVKGQSRLLKRQLECRFGALPQWATEKLTRASEHEFETWGDAILTAPTLEALFNTDVASS